MQRPPADPLHGAGTGGGLLPLPRPQSPDQRILWSSSPGRGNPRTRGSLGPAGQLRTRASLLPLRLGLPSSKAEVGGPVVVSCCGARASS